MSTQTHPPNDSRFDAYDPFSEPRTIPGGWDVSNLFAAERATRSGEPYTFAEERVNAPLDTLYPAQ